MKKQEQHTKWMISKSCEHKFCGQCPFVLTYGDTDSGGHRMILAMCSCSCHKDVHEFMASVMKPRK